MDIKNALRLLSEIPEGAKVIDIGGGAAPFPRADYVLDALPYQACGSGSDGNINRQLNIEPRYSADRWIQADLCDRTPWPIEDKSFDFAVCSHLLEDLRDPIWICSELQRIAKAGYIETPSRILEQSRGVENPCYTGYYHHRWLITRTPTGLEFRHKPHVLHSRKDAIVAKLSAAQRIAPEYAIVTMDWVESFTAIEVLEFSEEAVIAELCEFAQAARKLPNLREQLPTPLRRHIYYARLRMAGV